MKVLNDDDQSCEQIDERVTHHANADKFDSTGTANLSVGHLISTATTAREIQVALKVACYLTAAPQEILKLKIWRSLIRKISGSMEKKK